MENALGLRPGYRLRNGAMIVAVSGDIVLAVREGETYPYVTWALDEEGHAYRGRYYLDIEAALQNYARRARGSS